MELEEKLENYKIALADIIIGVIGTIVDQGVSNDKEWQELIDWILDQTEYIGDQEGLINSIADRADDALTAADPIPHDNAILVIGAIHFFKKMALRQVKELTKKPEEPTKGIHVEMEGEAPGKG